MIASYKQSHDILKLLHFAKAKIGSYVITDAEKVELNRQLLYSEVHKLNLHTAALHGLLESVAHIIKSTDINEVNEHGDTALIVSCRQGHVKMVELLLVNNADVVLSIQVERVPLM